MVYICGKKTKEDEEERREESREGGQDEEGREHVSPADEKEK